MSRNIVTEQKLQLMAAEVGTPPTQKADNYSSQIVKLIPVDVVGVYLGITSLIAGQQLVGDTSQILGWIVFGLVAIITPFYLWRVAGVNDKWQIFIVTVSFIIWAISLGGPFELLANGSKAFKATGLNEKFLGGILITIYTLVVPMFYKASQS